jgi:hypothetical protein
MLVILVNGKWREQKNDYETAVPLTSHYYYCRQENMLIIEIYSTLLSHTNDS